MKDNLKEYLTDIDNIISNKKNTNLSQIINNHLTQIVTAFVGSMTILFLLFGLLTNNIYLYILFASTFILFIPYIFYYYFLENGVQKLYKQYWLLLDKEKK